MPASFWDSLRFSNTSGLESTFRRLTDVEVGALAARLHHEPLDVEEHTLLKALVEPDMPVDVVRARLSAGIGVLTDLATIGSRDRQQRLERWASDPPLREALLLTAALRAERSSDALLEWLAVLPADDSADALIPIFMKALEVRDGSRLERFAQWFSRDARLAHFKDAIAAEREKAKSEWLQFVGALGLAGERPFTAQAQWRAKNPTIALVISPRRLNWFELNYGAQTSDSTLKLAGKGPLAAVPSLFAVPKEVVRTMRSRRQRPRLSVASSLEGDALERLTAWLQGDPSRLRG